MQGEPTEKLVRLTVWDIGIVMAENDFSRLFQPLIQLDASLAREYTGADLGLAMVRKLVELPGGNVGVESVFGHGSRSTVCLSQQAT